MNLKTEKLNQNKNKTQNILSSETLETNLRNVNCFYDTEEKKYDRKVFIIK